MVASDPATFTSVYGSEINLAGGALSGSLSNGGESVGLYTATGVLIEGFTYDDEPPWPTSPDGTGPSLEIKDPLGDHNDAANWRASRVSGGSPGESGALQGDFWGMLFGLIFFVPFFGLAVGAAFGALGGKMADYGIDDDFIKQTRAQVTEGTSALFLLTSDAVQDKVLEELKGFEFELISSNLTKEQEEQLMAAFAEE